MANVVDRASSPKAKPQNGKAFASTGSGPGQASSSKRKSTTKDEKKKKNNSNAKPAKANERSQAQVPTKRIYFHCKEQGHWRRNCPLYLLELEAKKINNNVPHSNLHVLEANYVSF